MIFYGEKNVYEAALDRFRFIFNEFYGKRPIVVTISGGKDSTVCLYLVKEIMDEMGIEKIPVLFLDQEAETPMTVEYIRYIMHLPWVEPYWVQSFFQEWNASKGDWFNVWGPGEQWCREKEPGNPYADLDLKVHQYFTHTLACAQKTLFGKSFVSIGGVRIEESPARLSGLTHGEVYEGITWGGGGGYYKDGTPRSMVLYPIWDWKVYDVWYYIFSKKIPYNKLYNYEFTQKPLRACRVSSLIHENAIHDVQFIKEVDPKFYNRLQKRVMNLNSVVQAHNSLIYWCDHLPPYFKDWDEYVCYLAENISEKKENGQKILKMYRKVRDKWLEKMGSFQDGIKYTQDFVGWYGCVCIIAEDFVGSRFRNVDRTMLQYYNDHYKEIKLAEIESKKQK
nr:MAG TPA: phosphoadenosine-phosphosulfate reductase [Caudoviricetes sp.]